MKFCTNTKILFLTDFEYVLLIWCMFSTAGIIINVRRRKREKNRLLKNSQKPIEIRGGYDEYNDIELEQFTELHISFVTKVKNAFLKFITQLATDLAQEEKKDRIRERIAACVDPNKIYLIQDKTIEKRVKALITYVQKEKGNLVQVIGFSILKPVLDSGLIPI